jgi:hypothetical protein
MRNFLFVDAVLVIAGAGVVFFASLVRLQQYWAFQVCASAYGLCEHWTWLGLIAAAAAFVAIALKATEI